MADESRDPLPASVNEYMREFPGATPATSMSTLDLPEKYHAQLKHYCTVTRYTLYAATNDCEKGEDLRIQTIEWSDVVDWKVPAEDLPPVE